MSTHANPTPPQTCAVNLRVRDDIRDLIDRAARAQGKTRSDFMIDAARRAAEESLIDQALIRVDPATYDLFVSVLDTPPGGQGFERLMAAKKPWQD
ncbi:MAG: DUF1778 domain-containing protein [Methylococcus sp.]|nr:MAG: DUF1778 domain-containing protein [Methylococcus sp.]